MKLFNSGKKKAAAVATVSAVILGGGVAYAYFTSTGSGDGNASVGSTADWAVHVNPLSGGPLLPDSGTQTLTYTVTNPSAGNQKLAGTTAGVKTDAASGDIYSGSTVATGCKALWFHVTNTSPAAVDLAASASTTGSLTVTMSSDGVNQDPCQGKLPVITVSAN